MGSFNEIQKGIPHLDTNYWQDLEKKEADDGVSDIVNMNCRTIFDKNEVPVDKKVNPSVFKKY